MYDLKDIKRLRKMLGITQAELARLTGVSQSLIAKIEAGKVDPGYTKAKRIFEALESLQKKRSRKVSEIMTKDVISIDENATVSEAVELMKKYSISQLPVLSNGEVVGAISEKLLVKYLSNGEDLNALLKKKAGEIMEEPFPTLNESAPLEVAAKLLNYYPAILIMSKGKMVGIVTRSDLFKEG